MADYHYHVFVSYARGGDVESWVRRFFQRELCNKLEEALGYPPSFFLDNTSLRSGQLWELALVNALRHSMCLVAVLSNTYFQSPWCVAEYASFRQRSRAFPGLGTHTLIVPARFARDRKGFPKDSRALQDYDFSPYSMTAPAFSNNDEYVEFEKLVRQFVETEVVGALGKAQTHFDPSWPVVVPSSASHALKTPNVVELETLATFTDMYVERPTIRRLTLAA